MATDVPEGVGATALGAAMMRARESARAGGLFVDPYAAAFVAAAPPIFEDGPDAEDDPAIAGLEAAFAEVVAVRTRFFDDFVTRAVTSGCRQVVIVGAGLDTRAFRLEWPTDVRLFELDRPDVLRFKERVLAENAASPRCERITVAVDLQQSGWSTSATDLGLEPAKPTAWVAEGLIPYLANDAAGRLLDAVGGLSSPGSHLALDHAGGEDDVVLRQARSMESMADIASMWQGGLSEGASRWLAHHGWRTETVHGETLSIEYGRRVSPATHRLHGVFVTAARPS
jgi:methyltransferase (TIGR00027 family)